MKTSSRSCPSHKPQKTAMISVSLALSQTSVYTAIPWIQGISLGW